jgi:hypothetical protein
MLRLSSVLILTFTGSLGRGIVDLLFEVATAPSHLRGVSGLPLDVEIVIFGQLHQCHLWVVQIEGGAL